MLNILLISGHKDIDSSIANRTIIDSITAKNHYIKVRYLDKLYPDYNIDVDVEQQALVSADIIILQFPIHWYNVPSLLAKWIEDTWTYGFAYGKNTKKLQNKEIILSFTSGSAESTYQASGVNKRPIDEYLNNLMQTIAFCGMHIKGIVYSDGMNYADQNDQHKMKIINDKLSFHTQKLENLLISAIKK